MIKNKIFHGGIERPRSRFPVALARRSFPRLVDRDKLITSWLLVNRMTSVRFPLTTVVLIELIQRLEPRDRRLVYRELPRHVFAGLSRGILLPGPTRLSSGTFISALRSALLP